MNNKEITIGTNIFGGNEEKGKYSRNIDVST